jgi:hypothetical protein
VHPDSSFRGLLEVSGSPLVHYVARLESSGVYALGVALPVVGSTDAVSGGKSISVQGLTRNATRATSLGIVNLAQYPAQCTLALATSAAPALTAVRSLAHPPLTQPWVSDALAGLADASGIADARALVSCDQSFYAWGLATDSSTGDLAVLHPATAGDSLLTAPGEQAPCPAGATCQTSPLVFSPDAVTPVGHVIFPAPAGVYHRLRMEMEVTFGEFYPQNPDGKHLIYWFVINRNQDMPGMLYFRGPEAYTALVRYGIALKHPQKLRLVDPNFKAVPGRTYHVVNDFDMGRAVYTVTITDVASGQVVSTMTGVPNVPQVTLKQGDRFLVDMGFAPGGDPDEVPSFHGWVYSKVRVDAIK